MTEKQTQSDPAVDKRILTTSVIQDGITTTDAQKTSVVLQSQINFPKNYTDKQIDIAEKRIEIRLKKKQAKQDKEETIQTSKHVIDNILYEQVIQEGLPYFVYKDTDEQIKYTPIIEDGPLLIEPLMNDAVKTGCVLLPSQPEPYESLSQLIDDIKIFIHKYLDVDSDFEECAAYIVLSSWVYDKLNNLCYPRFLGDTGTGKSRGLDVVGTLMYKPIMVNGCVTPAPIYRLQEMWKGTLVLDEADFQKSDTTNEVIKILNCGFERGRPVARCDPDDYNNVEFFDVYGPKCIATRMTFHDVALESRCLTQPMRMTTRKDLPYVLGTKFYSERNVLRNKLLMFRLDYWDKVSADDAVKIDLKGIEPRIVQATSGVASVMAWDAELLERFRRFLYKQQLDIIEERQNSPTGQVAMALLSLYDSDRWGCFTAQDVASELGEKWSSRSVGRHLKLLGCTTKQTKVNGVNRKLIDVSDEALGLIMKRYEACEYDLLCGIEQINQVTKVTFVTSAWGGLRYQVQGQKKKQLFEKEKLLGLVTIDTLSPHSDVTNVTRLPIETEVFDDLPDPNTSTDWDKKVISELWETNNTPQDIELVVQLVRARSRMSWEDCEKWVASQIEQGVFLRTGISGLKICLLK